MNTAGGLLPRGDHDMVARAIPPIVFKIVQFRRSVVAMAIANCRISPFSVRFVLVGRLP